MSVFFLTPSWIERVQCAPTLWIFPSSPECCLRGWFPRQRKVFIGKKESYRYLPKRLKGRREKDGAWHPGEDRVTMTTWRNTSQWESQGSDSSNTSLAQFPDHWPRCLLPVAYSTFPRAGLTPQTSTGPSPFFQDLNNVKSTHLEFHYLRDSLDEWVMNVFKKLKLLG